MVNPQCSHLSASDIRRNQSLYYMVPYWDSESGQTKCILNPELPLNDLDEIKAEIDPAILRFKDTDK